MESKCTAAQFTALTNAYTGEPLDVWLSTTCTGRVRFFVKGAYSPARRVATAELAYRLWNRTNGIEGTKDSQPIVCAYTGKPLVLRHDESGYWYEGGFDPAAMYSREQLLYFASMRKGVSKYPKPGPEVRVVRATEAPALKRKASAGAELTDEAVAVGEQIAVKFKNELGMSASSHVSMHVSKPKGGRHR